MDVREKLVELLVECVEENITPKLTENELTIEIAQGNIADRLIANGVTVQGDKDINAPNKWISVKDRLPESEKIVLVSAKSKTLGYRHTLMVAHIGHHEFTTEEYGWQEYEGETEYDEENDCFWIPECWYEVNSVEDNGNWIIDSDYEVTHWMPLPEPPKGE